MTEKFKRRVTGSSSRLQWLGCRDPCGAKLDIPDSTATGEDQSVVASGRDVG